METDGERLKGHRYGQSALHRSLQAMQALYVDWIQDRSCIARMALAGGGLWDGIRYSMGRLEDCLQ
jgi:hypothetical protein